MTRTRPPVSRARWIWALNATLVVACAVAGRGAAHDALLPGGRSLPWWVFIGAFMVTDLARFRIEYREQGYDLDLFELALVPGLVLCAPGWLVLARLVSTAVTIGILRRPPLIKLVFNLATTCLRVAVAIVVYQAILSHHAGGPGSALTWLGILLACISADALSWACLVTVISLASGRPTAREALELVLAGPALTLVTATLGVIAALILWSNPLGIWMLAVIGSIAVAGHRIHHQLRRRHANLRILSRFTREVSDAGTGAALLPAVLAEARGVLNAESVEILVQDGDEVAFAMLGPDGNQEGRTESTPRTKWLLAQEAPIRIGQDRTTTVPWTWLRPRPTRKGPGLITEAPYEVGLTDALVSPLGGHDGLAEAVIVMANRLGDNSHFDDDDLELASTLAGAAGLALRNGRLVDALRAQAAANEYQARHDPLTGLANRTLFLEEAEQAIARLIPGEMLAVMLVDLDDFKDVNDTLGHHFGDRLLAEVAGRLSEAVGPQALVARLGGDEFSVLVPSITSANQLELAQSAVHACLASPFLLDELSLQVRASLGVAVAPHHARDGSGLLKGADVAMYTAKARHCGTYVYVAEADQHSRRRLALGVELSDAVASGQFELHYQPQADFRTGEVVAVEALVRWNHPEYGLVPPDEFIGLAEQSGAIAELTRWVMRSSLADMSDWRRQGYEMDVSINVSPRNLLDARLTDDLARLYAEFDIDPRTVTLEITESGMVADPEQANVILGRLALGGTRISIDDFGTGHSSLSRLTHLPVSEIKIDRSFVDRMTTDSRDRAIVEATIQLSRTLDLGVVAEGIEDPFTWKALADLGCQRARGYVLSKPLRLEALLEFLSQRPARGDLETAARR
jgi:diguanylate cyclase (GGDEF)-like protein